MRVRSTRPVVLAVAVTAALTACTAPDTEPPAPTPTVAVFDEPSGLPPLTPGAPAWGSDTSPQVKHLDWFGALGDVAIIGGAGGDAATRSTRWIQAVDAATGAPRWTHEIGAPLPGTDAVPTSTSFTTVDDGGAGLVVTEYEREGCARGADDDCAGAPARDELGLVALSLADGAVRWLAPTVTREEAFARGDEPRSALMAGEQGAVVTAAGVVLALTGPLASVIGADVPEPGAMRTLALDPVSGALRWAVDDLTGRWLVGDAVVATAPRGAPGATGQGTGAPVVLDAATGAQRWSAAAEFPLALTRQPSSGLIAVHPVERSVLTGGVLLSLADGSRVADIGSATNVAASGTSDVVAWSPLDEHRTLRTIATGEPEPRLAASEFPDDHTGPELARGGYVLVTRVVSADETVTTLALDRSGATVGEPIEGRATVLTDRWLVTVDTREGLGDVGYNWFAVYAVGAP